MTDAVRALPLASESSVPSTPQTASALRRRWPLLALLLILLLAAGLRFANLQAIGDANTYYTAAVEAMRQSPRNFFFAAAEPGGSVSVDKPPVGLWIQAAFAAVLGVNGVAVVLPQILAGIASVALIYLLVRRRFGVWPGLLAALVLAVAPVSIAVDRNNTMDSTLILTLLVAAWAWLRAAETGRLGWLIGGAVLVGVAFNIKMLQAYLPLPAFIAAYWIGSKLGWRRRFGHLLLAGIVCAAVSLSWAVAVDLTPPDQRPYVGSSQSNSALELIFGYNGLQRLTGGGTNAMQPVGGNLPNGDGADGASNPVFTGTPFAFETGEPGPLRLFQNPLGSEAGWLLPFALVSLVALGWVARRERQIAPDVVLWGGWLLVSVAFFSVARFFHAYYLAMVSVPIAALIGMGAWALWRLRPCLLALLLLILAGGLSLFVQLTLVGNADGATFWQLAVGIFVVAGVALLFASRWRHALRFVGAGSLALALLIAPAWWSALTVNSGTNSVLPSAYRSDGDMPGIGGMLFSPGAPLNQIGSANSELVAYLEAGTHDTEYLVAVPNALAGASLVLETGRPVLYMGGFGGGDRVLTVESLAALVENGRLRYVLNDFGALSFQQPELADWLAANCTVDEDAPLSAAPFDASMIPLNGGLQPPAGFTPPANFQPPAGFQMPTTPNGNTDGVANGAQPDGMFQMPLGGMMAGSLYDCGR